MVLSVVIPTVGVVAGSFLAAKFGYVPDSTAAPAALGAMINGMVIFALVAKANRTP